MLTFLVEIVSDLVKHTICSFDRGYTLGTRFQCGVDYDTKENLFLKPCWYDDRASVSSRNLWSWAVIILSKTLLTCDVRLIGLFEREAWLAGFEDGDDRC